MGVKRDNPKAIEGMLTQLLGIAEYETKVGWFANAREENGEQTAYIASIQEFGVPQKNIPPRLGFREVATKKKQVWSNFIKAAASRVLEGRMNGQEAMESLGLKVSGDLMKQISSNPPPPLSERTLEERRRKGRTHTETMVDSGRMIESIESKTENV